MINQQNFRPCTGQHEPPPPRQHAGLLPESLIWAYIVQLSSALRTIHTAGLACRVMDPSKILITGKTRYSAPSPNKSLSPDRHRPPLSGLHGTPQISLSGTFVIEMTATCKHFKSTGARHASFLFQIEM